MTAVDGYRRAQAGESGVILCAREYMNSLDESSMEEIKQAIASVPWLQDFYDVGEKYIRTRDGRIKYVFAGLRHNLDSIKSKARILLAWIDEAESVSETAWVKLLPTVRDEGSEVWVTWNPEKRDSPTDRRFRQSPPSSYVGCEMNWSDNPFFPSRLNGQRLDDLERLDPNVYAHIWEGEYLEISDAQVFKGKFKSQEFKPQPDWNGPYFGLDFGFSQDPTAATKSYIHNRKLYIEYEAGKTGLELDDTSYYLRTKMPGIEAHTIRADNARPESISYLKRNGLNRITACQKGKGSVEDGIQFIKSFDEVIIHPRCVETFQEFRLYSYKVDRLTGDVLPILVDANNHYIDSLRYGLEPAMKKKPVMSAPIRFAG